MRALTTLVCALSLAACGLTAPRGSEGWADLDSLGLFDVNNTFTLSFGPSLLRFAALHLDDEPELRELLRSLDGVRIRSYEINRGPERVADRLDRMSHDLRAQGWEPIILVREPGEQTHLLIKSDGEVIHGLTVLTSDGREATVINVMGNLRPEFFSATMAALDVDTPPIRPAREPLRQSS